MRARGRRLTPCDAGAGTVLMVAVVLVALAVVAAVIPLTAVLVARQRVAATADSAALAAADTLRGLRVGDPCGVAAAVAAANDAELAACVPESDAITVTLTASVLGIAVDASSRAGAPELRDPAARALPSGG